MNGRVYDPTLSRFVSADPFVQFPKDSQSLNRYSYVLNNPLSYTDPSGLFLDDLFDAVGDAFSYVVDNPQIIIAIGVGIATGGAIYAALPATLSAGAAGAIAGAVGGFYGGLFASMGDWEAAAIGALSGAAFGYIGGNESIFGNTGQTTPQRVIGHGVVGGTSAEFQGGKFSSGFVSAGFAKYASGQLPAGISTAAGTTITAVIGGTASRITGGKFANGAVTAAFGYLFNSGFSGTAEGEGRSLTDDLRAIGKGIGALLRGGVSGLALLLRGDTPATSIYYHYGYATDAGRFIDGLHSGSYATDGPPRGSIMSGIEAQQMLALPNAVPPNSYYIVTVPTNVLVVGPMTVAPTTIPPRTGGGVEYRFPQGTPSGSVTGPYRLP